MNTLPVIIVVLCVFALATLTAAVLSIQNIFWPLTQTPGKELQGYLDIVLMVIFILGVVIVVTGAARRCLATLRGESIPVEAPPVIADGPKMGCC